MYFSESAIGVLVDPFHGERELVVLFVDIENHALNLLAEGDKLTRMLDMLGPAHFGNVDKTLDAFLDLHEGSVIGNGNHPAVPWNPPGT